jgi:hypothetical protein
MRPDISPATNQFQQLSYLPATNGNSSIAAMPTTSKTPPRTKAPKAPKGVPKAASAAKAKRNLSEADMAASARLKVIWDSIPKTDRPTQEQLADRWQGDGTANQSLISQYLHGRVALNYYALLFFANELGFHPEDVRNDLKEQQLEQSIALSQFGRLAVSKVAAAARVVSGFLKHRDAKLDLTDENEAGLLLDAVAAIRAVEGAPKVAEDYLKSKIADIAYNREVRSNERDRIEGAGNAGGKARKAVA